MLNRQRVFHLAGSALLCAIAMLIASCRSSSNPASIRQAQARFVRQYVDAVNSRDIQSIERLFSPNYHACINANNQPFFDRIISQKIRSQPATNYKITNIKAVTPNESLSKGILPDEGFSYPVKPTDIIQVDFEPTKDGSSFYSALLEVAPDHGSWFLVGPCPNEQGMEFFNRQMQQGQSQKVEARRLASEIQEPLRSELKNLLNGGQRVEAIERYSKQTGTSLSTAVRVIDALDTR
jgi:hypothetical protein